MSWIMSSNRNAGVARAQPGAPRSAAILEGGKPMFDAASRELSLIALGGGLLLVVTMWTAIIATAAAAG
jgi:hypothetical protein